MASRFAGGVVTNIIKYACVERKIDYAEYQHESCESCIYMTIHPKGIFGFDLHALLHGFLTKNSNRDSVHAAIAAKKKKVNIHGSDHAIEILCYKIGTRWNGHHIKSTVLLA